MTRHLPTLVDAKKLAKALRKRLADKGVVLGHSQALERIAQDNGFRDWNSFHAAIEADPSKSWGVGARVTGRYLSQPFAATILSSEPKRPGWFRLVLNLDEAVDVVRFESFSNLRKQIRIEVGPAGHSKERTSDGRPHVELDP
ncbi:MAG: glyoxalase superfamily protein [Pseudomonadota bacterium]